MSRLRADLPVSITDDEVYRYLPAILVATVDKLATVAFNPHFSHLTRGPGHRCPDHGFVTFPQGSTREPRAWPASTATREPRDWTASHPYDPAPALVIQDELHLLAEELGTFAAHYETLWQHLCRAGSGLPSKILAATATISDYANQVRQLYALRPRRFPSEGWAGRESLLRATPRRTDQAPVRGRTAIPHGHHQLLPRLRGRHPARAGRLRGLDPADVIAEAGASTIRPPGGRRMAVRLRAAALLRQPQDRRQPCPHTPPASAQAATQRRSRRSG